MGDARPGRQSIAPSKSAYLRTHWLTALSVALPFLRAIRLLRVVRLLRTLSLARILLTANRATRSTAAVLARHRFGYVAAVVTVFALLGAAGVSYFEQDAPGSPLAGFGEALWLRRLSAELVQTRRLLAEQGATPERPDRPRVVRSDDEEAARSA